jgi:hypothetical protein
MPFSPSSLLDKTPDFYHYLIDFSSYRYSEILATARESKALPSRILLQKISASIRAIQRGTLKLPYSSIERIRLTASSWIIYR